MFTSMFRIGEETGELSEMITKLADFYEDEVSSSVKVYFNNGTINDII